MPKKAPAEDIMAKANFLPNDEITYIPNAHAAKNPFLTREARL